MSPNLREKFLDPQRRARVQAAFKQSIARHEGGMEAGVQSLVQVLNPWFTALDPPADGPRFGSQVGEVIMFALAPVLGLLTGFVLAIGIPRTRFKKRIWRFLLTGCLGSVMSVVALFLLRRQGGIHLGMLYYSAVVGFLGSGIIGGFGRSLGGKLEDV